ncbi:hypothetical protein B0J11DRAFT_311346 [Dendryphion nanum]|uniref:Uncharacterized protein n=1 Tax=Dendryphion nanum TaxID=256645 RepID=A0A9P9IKI9_9PLEO|nr:hypothetical protein B0J11DRAFT_311346 [Dendryphion nanum]
MILVTSNDPDTLDEALKRIGKVDKIQLFVKMEAKSVYDIFMRLISRAALAAGTTSTEELEHHAQVFAIKILGDAFTLAEIQNFLQSYCKNSIKALDKVDSRVRNELNPINAPSNSTYAPFDGLRTAQ